MLTRILSTAERCRGRRATLLLRYKSARTQRSAQLSTRLRSRNGASERLAPAFCVLPRALYSNQPHSDSRALFQSLGILDEVKNKETITTLTTLLTQARSRLGGDVDMATARLIYTLVTQLKQSSEERRGLLLGYICDRKITSKEQLKAAVEYLKSNPVDPINRNEFELQCGVGVAAVSTEEIAREVSSVIEQYRQELEAERGFPLGKLIDAVRVKLKWTDPKKVKEVLEEQLSTLGYRVPGKGKRHSLRETPEEEKSSKIGHSFHKPGENYLTEGYVVTPATMDLLQKHLRETGGKVVTRFPPEPNGILHIGHAMAINLSFGYAKDNDGICYLRYDDTNPEKAEEKFIRGIQEMVEWLGHKPFKITFASDYYPRLYELARELILRGHGYVCHQPSNEMRVSSAPPSPWRDRPAEESLRLFEDMKNGKYKEGEATLRMKLTMEDGKQDPVAYRVKHTAHPRTGAQWCIYPTYDFAHCLCDSIENITHSLCTREFQIRRSSYYWLCNAVGVYCPVQWEFGRLNMHYALVSKRKIQKLINDGIVRDWDDPRLFTLMALRRRGFPPTAINKFCEEYGVMTSDGAIFPELLESFVRNELNRTATRAMAVLDPLKVSITNFPNSKPWVLEVPNVPKDPEKGTHQIPLNQTLFIERSDFMESPTEGYRRLAPDQPVGLKHASYVLELEEIVKDSSGSVIELRVRGRQLSQCVRKPKAFIHWVSDPRPCQVRLYNKLFLDKEATCVNPHSLQVVAHALVDWTLQEAAALLDCAKQHFQFERIGYFTLDPDSTPNKLVFNRTVSLKKTRVTPYPFLDSRKNSRIIFFQD